MSSSALLKTGIIGMLISAVCCFTPVLVIVFGMLGLAAWVADLDYILMPALLFFLLLTVFAFKQKDKQGASHD